MSNVRGSGGGRGRRFRYHGSWTDRRHSEPPHPLEQEGPWACQSPRRAHGRRSLSPAAAHHPWHRGRGLYPRRAAADCTPGQHGETSRDPLRPISSGAISVNSQHGNGVAQKNSWNYQSQYSPEMFEEFHNPQGKGGVSYLTYHTRDALPMQNVTAPSFTSSNRKSRLSTGMCEEKEAAARLFANSIKQVRGGTGSRPSTPTEKSLESDTVVSGSSVKCANGTPSTSVLNTAQSVNLQEQHLGKISSKDDQNRQSKCPDAQISKHQSNATEEHILAPSRSVHDKHNMREKDGNQDQFSYRGPSEMMDSQRSSNSNRYQEFPVRNKHDKRGKVPQTESRGRVDRASPSVQNSTKHSKKGTINTSSKRNQKKFSHPQERKTDRSSSYGFPSQGKAGNLMADNRNEHRLSAFTGARHNGAFKQYRSFVETKAMQKHDKQLWRSSTGPGHAKGSSKVESEVICAFKECKIQGEHVAPDPLNVSSQWESDWEDCLDDVLDDGTDRSVSGRSYSSQRCSSPYPIPSVEERTKSCETYLSSSSHSNETAGNHLIKKSLPYPANEAEIEQVEVHNQRKERKDKCGNNATFNQLSPSKRDEKIIRDTTSDNDVNESSIEGQNNEDLCWKISDSHNNTGNSSEESNWSVSLDDYQSWVLSSSTFSLTGNELASPFTMFAANARHGVLEENKAVNRVNCFPSSSQDMSTHSNWSDDLFEHGELITCINAVNVMQKCPDQANKYSHLNGMEGSTAVEDLQDKQDSIVCNQDSNKTTEILQFEESGNDDSDMCRDQELDSLLSHQESGSVFGHHNEEINLLIHSQEFTTEPKFVPKHVANHNSSFQSDWSASPTCPSPPDRILECAERLLREWSPEACEEAEQAKLTINPSPTGGFHRKKTETSNFRDWPETKPKTHTSPPFTKSHLLDGGGDRAACTNSNRLTDNCDQMSSPTKCLDHGDFSPTEDYHNSQKYNNQLGWLLKGEPVRNPKPFGNDGPSNSDYVGHNGYFPTYYRMDHVDWHPPMSAFYPYPKELGAQDTFYQEPPGDTAWTGPSRNDFGYRDYDHAPQYSVSPGKQFGSPSYNRRPSLLGPCPQVPSHHVHQAGPRMSAAWASSYRCRGGNFSGTPPGANPATGNMHEFSAEHVNLNLSGSDSRRLQDEPDLWFSRGPCSADSYKENRGEEMIEMTSSRFQKRKKARTDCPPYLENKVESKILMSIADSSPGPSACSGQGLLPPTTSISIGPGFACTTTTSSSSPSRGEISTSTTPSYAPTKSDLMMSETAPAATVDSTTSLMLSLEPAERDASTTPVQCESDILSSEASIAAVPSKSLTTSTAPADDQISTKSVTCSPSVAAQGVKTSTTSVSIAAGQSKTSSLVSSSTPGHKEANAETFMPAKEQELISPVSSPCSHALAVQAETTSRNPLSTAAAGQILAMSPKSLPSVPNNLISSAEVLPSAFAVQGVMTPTTSSHPALEHMVTACMTSGSTPGLEADSTHETFRSVPMEVTTPSVPLPVTVSSGQGVTTSTIASSSLPRQVITVATKLLPRPFRQHVHDVRPTTASSPTSPGQRQTTPAVFKPKSVGRGLTKYTANSCEGSVMPTQSPCTTASEGLPPPGIHASISPFAYGGPNKSCSATCSSDMKSAAFVHTYHNDQTSKPVGWVTPIFASDKETSGKAENGNMPMDRASPCVPRRNTPPVVLNKAPELSPYTSKPAFVWLQGPKAHKMCSTVPSTETQHLGSGMKKLQRRSSLPCSSSVYNVIDENEREAVAKKHGPGLQGLQEHTLEDSILPGTTDGINFQTHSQGRFDRAPANSGQKDLYNCNRQRNIHGYTAEPTIPKYKGKTSGSYFSGTQAIPVSGTQEEYSIPQNALRQQTNFHTRWDDDGIVIARPVIKKCKSNYSTSDKVPDRWEERADLVSDVEEGEVKKETVFDSDEGSVFYTPERSGGFYMNQSTSFWSLAGVGSTPTSPSSSITSATNSETPGNTVMDVRSLAYQGEYGGSYGSNVFQARSMTRNANLPPRLQDLSAIRKASSATSTGSISGLASVDWTDWKTHFQRRYNSCRTEYIDTHCHLDFLFNRSGFQGSFSKFKLVNKETFPKNFGGCVAVFCDPRTFKKDGGLWKDVLQESDVYGAIGCHPKSARDFTIYAEENLREMLKHKKVKALGEIGLDYSGTFGLQKEIQKDVFRRQCKIAQQLLKPLVIHSREAEEDTIAILQECVPANYRIHRHCFTGTWQEAETWLKKFPNSYIGLTPLVTYSRGRATDPREVACNIPLNKLLLETDAPYFIPRGISKEDMPHSHPGMAITVAHEVAFLQRINVEEVLGQCRNNTYHMYQI